MPKNLSGLIDRFHRPYTLDENELLKLCKIDINKPQKVDAKLLVKKSKLENSPSSDFNVRMWTKLIEERFIPSIGGPDNYKQENAQAFSALICIGIFHNESLFDTPDSVESDIYKAAIDYASKLMCPEPAMEQMMKERASVQEMMKQFDAPELCVMTSIGNILQKHGYRQVK